jgi:hypothetical protein
MRIVEVNTKALANEFLLVAVRLYKNDPNYIRPLDKDINEVFDATKNKSFRFGEAARWLLQNDEGEYIGRIAAFVHKKYKSKGDTQPTGGFGFFDCIDHQPSANLLLDTAKEWLAQRGMEAMDGPINFGERDKWWGLLVEGFDPPLYGMNYNFPYYQALLENYGCQVFFYQNCYSRQVKPRLPEKFYSAHNKYSHLDGYTAKHGKKSDLKKMASDFCTVYNAAWASHEGNKQMAEAQALKMFQTMKPIMDERLIWFAYYQEKPIGMYISLPDLNQLFKYLNGQWDTFSKLKFLFYRWKGVVNKMTGIVFGILPEYQGAGIDYFMIVESAKVIQNHTPYHYTELQWQGDFNPKINNISKNLGFSLSRRLATYRFLFDRQKEFKRHPLI